jgi:hypothetical protein
MSTRINTVGPLESSLSSRRRPGYDLSLNLPINRKSESYENLKINLDLLAIFVGGKMTLLPSKADTMKLPTANSETFVCLSSWNVHSLGFIYRLRLVS